MLEKFCIRLVRILLGVILLFLTILSALVTCRVYGGAEIVQYENDSPILHVVFCVGIIALLMIINSRKDQRNKRIKVKNQENGSLVMETDNGSGFALPIKKEIFWVILAAVGYILWIVLVPSWGCADSHWCMTSAKGLLGGDYRAWEPVPFDYGSSEGALGYAYTYPSQNGLILYMAVLRLFFGDAAHVVFQILNIFFFVLGVISLHKVVCGEREDYALLWMLFCLPFSFYILFVYGTVPGFGLSCMSMNRLVRYVKEDKGKDFWIGALYAAAAVLFKSNYLIVIIAFFLYLASSGIFKKKYSLLAASVLLILVYVMANRGVKAGISARTGYEVSDGAPMIAWVEMGLQEGSRGPGWYNGYQISLFSQADGDSELVSEWVKEDLKETLSDMTSNPFTSVKFFVKKIASIWAEPTFQSLWIQEVGNSSWEEGSLPWQLFKEEGFLNRIYVFAANLMQTFVYAMSFVWIFAGFRDKDPDTNQKDGWSILLPGIIFIGGFLFHIFWEAKAQYTTVYFMLLLPYAYQGIGYAQQFGISFRKKFL